MSVPLVSIDWRKDTSSSVAEKSVVICFEDALKCEALESHKIHSILIIILLFLKTCVGLAKIINCTRQQRQ